MLLGAFRGGNPLERIVAYVETGRKPASRRFEPSAGRMVAKPSLMQLSSKPCNRSLGRSLANTEGSTHLGPRMAIVA